MRRLFTLLILMVWSFSAVADNHGGLIMHRSTQTFPEAMLALQTTIAEHGYTVSRVQRVDIGLTKSGYETDKYRVVFFGKPSEIRAVKHSEPQLIAYLPMKVVIFSEGNETMLVAADTSEYSRRVKQPHIRDLLVRWNNDIRSIFSDVK